MPSNKLRPPGADQTAEAEDLALVQAERGIVHVARHASCARTRSGDLVGGVSRFVRIELGHVAAHHQAGHLDGLKAFDVASRDRRPSRRTVTRSAMAFTSFSRCGDVEDGAPCARSRRMISNRLSASTGRQHRRRLVEHHDPVRHEKRAGDLHQLPVGDGEAAHLGVGMDARAEPLQDDARLARMAAVIDEAAADAARGREKGSGRRSDRARAGSPDARGRCPGCSASTGPGEHNRLSVQMKRSPFVGRRCPDRIRISVDLPAPFSPMTAWISPASRSSEMSLRTSIGPNDFEMRSARRTTAIEDPDCLRAEPEGSPRAGGAGA